MVVYCIATSDVSIPRGIVVSIGRVQRAGATYFCEHTRAVSLSQRLSDRCRWEGCWSGQHCPSANPKPDGPLPSGESCFPLYLTFSFTSVVPLGDSEGRGQSLNCGRRCGHRRCIRTFTVTEGDPSGGRGIPPYCGGVERHVRLAPLR